MGLADFKLPYGKPWLVAFGTIFLAERERQTIQPAVEKSFDLFLSETMADLLKTFRLIRAQKAIV
jgi:hypothetical protein